MRCTGIEVEERHKNTVKLILQDTNLEGAAKRQRQVRRGGATGQTLKSLEHDTQIQTWKVPRSGSVRCGAASRDAGGATGQNNQRCKTKAHEYKPERRRAAAASDAALRAATPAAPRGSTRSRAARGAHRTAPPTAATGAAPLPHPAAIGGSNFSSSCLSTRQWLWSM